MLKKILFWRICECVNLENLDRDYFARGECVKINSTKIKNFSFEGYESFQKFQKREAETLRHSPNGNLDCNTGHRLHRESNFKKNGKNTLFGILEMRAWNTKVISFRLQTRKGMKFYEVRNRLTMASFSVFVSN